MTLTAPPPGDGGPVAQVDALLDELAELQGQRNALDARIVDIVRQLGEHDRWGITGAKSLTGCIEWKTGATRAHARALVSVAERAESFPSCVQGLAEGRLSLDQVATITRRAADGTDAHYAQLAESATVKQLRTALSLAPKPDPAPEPPSPLDPPEREVTKTTDDTHTTWRIRLPHPDAARFDNALQSHRDALIAQWTRDHERPDGIAENAPPFPTLADAFLALVDAGWDSDVAARPHGHHTTVVLHVDVESKLASLHLGPALPTLSAATCPAKPGSRPGSNATANPSAAAGPPARSPVASAAPSNTATATAPSPAAAPPTASTPTTSGTGKTAAPPNCGTWCSSAPTTTGCTTKASSPSTDLATE